MVSMQIHILLYTIDILYVKETCILFLYTIFILLCHSGMAMTMLNFVEIKSLYILYFYKTLNKLGECLV